jgi:predicted transcriptional regulator
MQDSLHAFRLDSRGLARLFGELEAQLIEAVWQLGSPTVAEVCGHLGGGANPKTVMTVLNRLVAKRVLRRARDGRAYRYSTLESQADFVSRVSRRVAEELIHDYGVVAVAGFVQAMDNVDPSLLAALEELLRGHHSSPQSGARAIDAEP